MNDLFAERLKEIAMQNLARSLMPRVGIDLSSNDYLGFAEDEELKQRILNRLTELPAIGAAGSRLLRGTLEIFTQLEEELAAFVNREQALLFSSGYQANIAVMSALLRQEDIVFSDELNHASIIDGIRLSRAEKFIYSHRDLQMLEDGLKQQQHNKRLKLIVTESLFSMEGTVADLKTLTELASRYGAYLIVDEAHSTGIWGHSLVAEQGLEEQVFATIHAGGKALGVSGAWVAGGALLKEYLVNFARPFIFSTAPMPTMAILLQEAVRFYKKIGRERAQVILARAQQVKARLSARVNLTVMGPILPIFIGANEIALEVSRRLQAHGWDVRAIRPPTVPYGTARLRTTIKWHNDEKQLKKFVTDMEAILVEVLPE